ncbi:MULTISPECIES: hypothetical protein [Rhodopseudomonas]|uniref:hypothetical protein n=1 Tax=Rhodopseudomonas TaxID=1073 RepID=UPI000A5838B5|nr:MULTISPECIES: hypothetical protein [Rhodopseudomonas]MDF3809103.1 hypothetical protein [Rhodopseudomonas sp. BAL398]WOK16422.1 hypothetical protein RBJ75_19980 [Rhodopseudomonas sp. BAL398]
MSNRSILAMLRNETFSEGGHHIVDSAPAARAPQPERRQPPAPPANDEAGQLSFAFAS